MAKDKSKKEKVKIAKGEHIDERRDIVTELVNKAHNEAKKKSETLKKEMGKKIAELKAIPVKKKKGK